MADRQANTTSDTEQGSPFARPAFLVAAVLVLVILLLGVVVAVRVSRNSDAVAPPSSSSSQVEEPSSTPQPTDPSTSVCGLPGSTDDQALTVAPAAAWQYEGATAYPTSPEFGPGKTASEGYRFCFQHSQEGAVFTAANAIAVPQEAEAKRAWIGYFVSTGPNRQQLLDTMNEPTSTATGVRLKVVGFKVLAYTGTTARVDIAVEATSAGQVVTASYVYELTWQSGDWKLNSDAPNPFNFSTVSSSASYVQWSG